VGNVEEAGGEGGEIQGGRGEVQIWRGTCMMWVGGVDRLLYVRR
jgi:hypothetical protein